MTGDAAMRLIGLMLLLLSAATCGQEGPLYLPEEPSYLPEESRAWDSAAASDLSNLTSDFR